MRIIDDKGRLFGKLNVIDFLVVLFLLSLVPAFLLLNKIIFMDEPELPTKWITLEVKFSRLDPKVAEAIQENDIEQNEFGTIIARVNSIISLTPAVVTDIYEGEFVVLDHPFDKDMLISIDVLCEEIEGIYYFKNRQLQMGRDFTVTTDLYAIEGLIVKKEFK